MIIFPAIDLMDGKVVRLQQGDFTRRTTYQLDPVEVAKQYEQDGATWLHIVDLDGAKTGQATNLDVIQAIRTNTSLRIQVGGGIRNKESVERLLSIGVDRVIVGTLAVRQPDVLASLMKQYPKQIIVSVDSKNGFVTDTGWQGLSSIPTAEFVAKLEQIGVDTIVYTDIAKDGMMEGPAWDDYEMLSQLTSMNVIASGGVSTLADVIKLNDSNIYGAIIGKALYQNAISLQEAIRCSQDESSLV